MSDVVPETLPDHMTVADKSPSGLRFVVRGSQRILQQRIESRDFVDGALVAINVKWEDVPLVMEPPVEPS